MRARPDISDEAIFACLDDSYGLHASGAAFLPVGADFNAFAFRVAIDDGTFRMRGSLAITFGPRGEPSHRYIAANVVGD